MPFFLTLLLAIAAVAFVAWPLFHRAAPVIDDEPPVDALRERQRAAVEALRELDYERQIGNLTEPDYFALRERYARQAMALLKVIDQREAARDQALERAIEARRGGAVGSIATAGVAVAGRPSAGRARWSWLITATGSVLALAVAAALLATTVRRSTRQPEAISTVPLPAAQALAYDPASGNVLAANANGLAQSADGGKTWQPLATIGLAAGASSLFVGPDRQGLLALTGDRRLLRSFDGGRTWDAAVGVPRLPDGARAVAEAPGTPPLLVAATTSGMYASSDGGQTWAVADGFVNGLLPTRNDRDVAYAPTADQSTGPRGQTFQGLLFVATEHGLYVSNDGAQSWFARPLGGDLVAVTVDPRNPRTVLAMDSHGAVFRSDDAGQTWRARNG